MTALPDTLRRLQDELARAPHPGHATIWTEHILIRQGDVYTIKEESHVVDAQLAFVAHPADADTIAAVLTEWGWHVDVQDKPPPSARNIADHPASKGERSVPVADAQEWAGYAPISETDDRYRYAGAIVAALVLALWAVIVVAARVAGWWPR